MGREYKAKDQVIVFTKNPFADGFPDYANLKHKEIISRKLYSANGFDSYRYKKSMYDGYYHPLIGIYIIVTESK